MLITNRGIDSNSKFQKPTPSSPSDGNSSNDFAGFSPSSSKMKRNLPISQKKKFKYSITFQSFDEESLEAGDSFDRGYEVEDTIDLIGDILYKAYSTYGIYMPVAFGTWESTNPLENTDFYEKGIQKYFANLNLIRGVTDDFLAIKCVYFLEQFYWLRQFHQ